MSQISLSDPSWHGALADLANVIQHIKRLRASGRLSLRNVEHLSIAHLYFRGGKLVHVVGHRGNAQVVLLDVRNWSRATLRFDQGVTTTEVTMGDEYEQLLMDVLTHLSRRGVIATPPTAPTSSPSQAPRIVQNPQRTSVPPPSPSAVQTLRSASTPPPPPSPSAVQTPRFASTPLPSPSVVQAPRPAPVPSSPPSVVQTPRSAPVPPPSSSVVQTPRSPVPQTPPLPRVIEGDVIISSEVKQLVAPEEWHQLVEATRRVSLAVAHLVGPKEARSVLQDILDDCSTSFPAFTCLRISPAGYLQVTDYSHLDRLSRDEILEAFTALIAICQYFCTPIIGEKEAHKLMIQALQELGPAMASLGVFRVDSRLLASGNF